MADGINVLSLFDGMSCGQIALERAGIKVNQYFASEIDKYAIAVTMANYPNTIQLGDVRFLNLEKLPKIDLLIGGSPCQSFSFAGKRKGMSTKEGFEILSLDHYSKLKNQGFEFDGQSYLFWEYMNALEVLKPKYFLLENVEMGPYWETILSNVIGCQALRFNSNLVSAQNRARLYWTNIGKEPAGLFGYLENTIERPKDRKIFLRDILENEVSDKYYLSPKAIDFVTNPIRLKKKYTQDASVSKKSLPHLAKNQSNFCGDFVVTHNMMPRSSKSGKGGIGHLSKSDGKSYCLDTGQTNAIEIVAMRRKGKKGNIEQKFETNGINNIRRLTPKECERLQTVPENYTILVSDNQRYKMLGNGWTVDIVAYIFSYLKF